ncbi:MAG TPA: heme-binding protein [Steroidobacteraceae bacterium]|nr:heme-binding protein [Steroidobacteraceae bacterium]
MSPRLALTAVFLAAVAAGTASSVAQQPAPAAAPYPLDDVPEKMAFDIPYGPPITLERAMTAIAAAAAEARRHDWKLDIAVVDSGGNLVAFERMDGAQLASIQIAEHKARASANFRRETKVFEKAIQQSGSLYVLTVDGVIGSRGGIPLVEGGKLIGAIGCSGGAGSQDEVACKAGVAAIIK